MANPDPEKLSLFMQQRAFRADDSLKDDQAEGATVYWIPAAVYVVRDQMIFTVCSGCLKSFNAQCKSQLQKCSKCKFVRYCSTGCQVSDQSIRVP